MALKIVVAAEEAAVFDGDARVADIVLVGGLADGMFGGVGAEARKAELAQRTDADLREQAVPALAGDYCPPHLRGQRDAVRALNAARDYSAPALATRAAHDAARWEWARQVAPTLPVERPSRG